MKNYELILYFLSLFFAQLSSYVYYKIDKDSGESFWANIPYKKFSAAIYMMLAGASGLCVIGFFISGFFFIKWYLVILFLIISSLFCGYIYGKTKHYFSIFFTIILFPIGVILFSIFIKNNI